MYNSLETENEEFQQEKMMKELLLCDGLVIDSDEITF